jgi:hypothetical protein
VTLVSLGAVHNATLATLAACDAEGCLDVVEPQVLNGTDLNRYVLGFPADLGRAKMELVWNAGATSLGFTAYGVEYQEFRESAMLPLKIALVGVDNHPARWAVQGDWPEVLLCAGTHWDTVQISRHAPFGPACVGCVYPEGPEIGRAPNERIEPTVSFVSAAAGILLAAELIKEVVPAFRAYRLDNLLYLSLMAPSTLQLRQARRSAACPCHCDQRVTA